MTWKLYALLSSGGVLATYLVSAVPTPRPDQAGQVAVPRAEASAGPVVDLTEQADRLRAGVAAATAYHEPVRNAFRFVASPRPSEPPSLPSPIEAAGPVLAPPPRPPFALAGMASTVDRGVAQRTAILTSLQGVVLVNEGDLLQGGYRVVAIDETGLTVEATIDGTRTTLQLAGGQ